MEEDEEVHSSPSSPTPSDNRTTVSVAAAPPPSSPPPENALILALPQPHKSKNNCGGREDCWSEAATGVLIDAWGERYLELSRGNLKQKHWKEVADIVSSRADCMKTPKTDIQCKNRIDTVKKKYKLEKAKVAAGGGASKWVFFEKLDELIGPSAKIPANAAASSGGSGGSADFLSKVPMGIPVGIRSSLNPYRISQRQQQQKQARRIVLNNQMKQGPVDLDSDEEDADSFDSLPPPPPTGKRVRSVAHKGGNSGEKRRKRGELG